MSAASRTLPILKARSRVGTSPSRTASCSRTRICQARQIRQSATYHRHQENLGNLKPADLYPGAAETILKRRKDIKRKTIANRRLRHRQTAA